MDVNYQLVFMISMLPIATDKHSTFFIWNLMVAFISSTLFMSGSWWVARDGNLPALFSPGPSRRGICLIRDSDARKPLYFLANFLTSFLFLFNFLRSSTLMNGRLFAFASSQCNSSPKIQIFSFCLGICFNLTVPENRLSFWGS